jgi:MFS family permease
MPEARRSGGYWRLLRTNRDFRRLYAATLISLAGDWFLTVALLDLVLEISGSATLASIVVVLQTLPAFFFSPFAGHLIDRVDRKKLMIWVDVIRAGAALLPLLAHDRPTLVFAFAGVAMISIGLAYFDPAASAALPNMVREEDLGAANVLIGSTWGTMLAVGAALGGVVTMQWGRNTAFVVDAATFLLSALIILSIRAPFSAPREKHAVHASSFIASLRETVRFARDNPRVLALLGSKGGFGIGGGVVAMLSVFGREVFTAGAVGIGVLYAARGLGALIGPFIVRGFSQSDDDQYRKIAWCGAIFGLGYMALAVSDNLIFAAAMVMLAHLGGGAQWQTSTYGLQREVPDSIRGRVFSVDYGFVTLTMSLSGIASGWLTDRWGAKFGTMSVASLCLVWSLIWGIGTRRLWRRSEEGRALG